MEQRAEEAGVLVDEGEVGQVVLARLASGLDGARVELADRDGHAERLQVRLHQLDGAGGLGARETDVDELGPCAVLDPDAVGTGYPAGLVQEATRLLDVVAVRAR